MAMEKADKIWYNGEFVNWDDAKIHVLSHALHYGTSFFEGARCYKTVRGSACFRLKDHIKRLYNSMKIYRTEPTYTIEEMIDAVIATIHENHLEACYIRPIIFRGYGELGVGVFKRYRKRLLDLVVSMSTDRIIDHLQYGIFYILGLDVRLRQCEIFQRIENPFKIDVWPDV